MAPPKVRFLTKIYHPNIGVLVLFHTFSILVNSYHLTDKLGRICLDILKGLCDFPNSREWSLYRTLQTNGHLPCRLEPFYCLYKPCLAHQILMTLSPPMLQNITRRMRRMLNGLAGSGLRNMLFEMTEPCHLPFSNRSCGFHLPFDDVSTKLRSLRQFHFRCIDQIQNHIVKKSDVL